MTALSEGDRRALEQMWATFPTLEAWRVRSRNVEEPERGSEAALDNAIWRWMPPSEVARQSLVAATQHLNLARTAIEAKDIYPSSHFTVLRGGLVGASQAVWILGPDDRIERQQRALRVVDEWYRRALQNSTEYLPLIADTVDRLDMQRGMDHMQDRRDEARGLLRKTSTLSEKQSLELTDVIVWSASEVLNDPLRGPRETVVATAQRRRARLGVGGIDPQRVGRAPSGRYGSFRGGWGLATD